MARMSPVAAVALAGLLAGSAAAQEDPGAGKALLAAKELLRTGRVEDRIEAIRRLIELDSAPAITCLEEAIQRSAAEMEKLSKEVDAKDAELADAEWEMEFCRERYPSLYGEKVLAFKAVKKEWDALSAVMRGHLDICLSGSKSFASFRSEGAVDRIVKGATGSTSPLARQMYIQALGAPGMEKRIPVLIEILKAGESRVRAAAVRSLRGFRPRKDVLEAVLPLLKDRCWAVRVGAAEVVARMPIDVAIPHLVEALSRETGEPALQVASLLHSLTGVSLGTRVEPWREWWKRNEEAIRVGGWRRPEEAAPAEEGTKTEAAFFLIPVESDNLLLVMDLSGSMGADMKSVDSRTSGLLAKHGFGQSRLAVALVQAYQMIEGLPGSSRINIMTFSEKVTRFGSRAAPATVSLKKNAVQWLNTQKTGRMTNIWDSLRQGFGDHMAAGGATRFDELPDTIIFLTDGVPTAGRFRDEQSLCDLVELWNASAGVVIHCVGIGEEFDESLLEKLTTTTGGFYMDTRTNRIRGKRVRLEVPEDRRCPIVPEMAGRALDEYESANAEERLGMIPWLAALCSWTADGLPILARGLDDPEEGIPAASAAGLASVGTAGIPFLAAALAGDRPAGALAAARALGEMGAAAAEAIPALEKAAGVEGDLGAAAKAALAKIRAKPKGK
jgi:hypothetical protein